MSIRDFRPTERCFVNGYLVEVERHARRTSFVRVLDARLPGMVRVQLDKKTPARASDGQEQDASAGKASEDK